MERSARTKASHGAAGRPLQITASRARTFYNVADALIPPGEGRPGGGELDLVPASEERLRALDPRSARQLLALLWLLEWQPRFCLRSLSGFSWLPRTERRVLLEGWRLSRLALCRRLFHDLQALVREAYAAHPRVKGTGELSS